MCEWLSLKNYMRKRLKVSRKWWRRPQKSLPIKEKKMKGKDEVGLKRILAQERTPSLIALSMGEIETSVGSSILPQF
jgi:hypothetical protein